MSNIQVVPIQHLITLSYYQQAINLQFAGSKLTITKELLGKFGKHSKIYSQQSYTFFGSKMPFEFTP